MLCFFMSLVSQTTQQALAAIKELYHTDSPISCSLYKYVPVFFEETASVAPCDKKNTIYMPVNIRVLLILILFLRR